MTPLHRSTVAALREEVALLRVVREDERERSAQNGRKVRQEESVTTRQLPGRIQTLTIRPRFFDAHHPQEDGRVLHGTLSSALQIPHAPMRPAFSLWRDREECWQVYWYDPRGTPEAVLALVYGETRRIFFSPSAPVQIPESLPPGRYAVEIESAEPIVTTHTDRRGQRVPSMPSMGTVAGWLSHLPGRIGLPPGEVYAFRLLSYRQVDRFVGGSFRRGHGQRGMVRCWHGRVRVECDQDAARLFLCAQVTGLGGLTSIGFGRVRVRPRRLHA